MVSIIPHLQMECQYSRVGKKQTYRCSQGSKVSHTFDNLPKKNHHPIQLVQSPQKKHLFGIQWSLSPFGWVPSRVSLLNFICMSRPDKKMLLAINRVVNFRYPLIFFSSHIHNIQHHQTTSNHNWNQVLWTSIIKVVLPTNQSHQLRSDYRWMMPL